MFAISKEYFGDIGTYDAGMEIWGGENLEISFRIWMCGGTLLTIPCSRIAHIFRDRSPYKWKPGTNVVQKNSIRLAEVWMDEYKELYYEKKGINHKVSYFRAQILLQYFLNGTVEILIAHLSNLEIFRKVCHKTSDYMEKIE